MALGGSSVPPPPQPEPQVPVPQDDSADSLKTKQAAAKRAKGQDGYSAHLLSDKGYDKAAGSSPGPTGKARMLG